MSNLKQMGLAVLQYAQDYDETNPMASGYAGQSNWWDASWVTMVQPYIKNIGVFRCPSDGEDKTKPSWVRDAISYSINAYIPDNKYGATIPGGDWLGGGWHPAITLADLNRPSDTILIAERHNDDLQKHGWDGNGYVGSAAFTGVNWMDGWFGYGEIPDGSNAVGSAYPNGPAGTVTVAHSGVANFAFCDGHVKAMNPERTNPQKGTQAEKDAANLWDASRK